MISECTVYVNEEQSVIGFLRDIDLKSAIPVLKLFLASIRPSSGAIPYDGNLIFPPRDPKVIFGSIDPDKTPFFPSQQLIGHLNTDLPPISIY